MQQAVHSSSPSRQRKTGGAGSSAYDANKGFRSTEWRLAADKLDQMVTDTADTAEGLGAACGWDAAVFRLETSDFISVTGDIIHTQNAKNVKQVIASKMLAAPKLKRRPLSKKNHTTLSVNTRGPTGFSH